MENQQIGRSKQYNGRYACYTYPNGLEEMGVVEINIYNSIHKAVGRPAMVFKNEWESRPKTKEAEIEWAMNKTA